MAFLVCVLVLVLCSVPRSSTQQSSASGVRLCLDNTQCSRVIPNNTILHPGNISRNGLSCVSPLEENDIGGWFYPNGEEITRSRNSEFTSLSRVRHVVLIRGDVSFTSDAEGVYTCHIPDESRVQQTLYVGMYRTNTYENSSGPVLETPVSFHLLTSLSSHPPSFTLNCTSSHSPPTTVTWTRNGETLNSNSPYSISQVLRNAISTTYNSLLTVQGSLEGEYSCTVANDRGSQSANLNVVAPSRPPGNVTALAIGNNQVRVSWIPPVNVSGYQLLYTTNTSTGVSLVNIEDSNAVEYIFGNLSAEVRYTISVVAYANLPSEQSEPVNIELRLPGAPTDVQTTVTSSTSILVSWRIPSSEEVIDGFEVSFTPVNSCPEFQGGSEVVEGGSVTQHTIRNLKPSSTYSIRVRARGLEGLGPFSVAGMGMTHATAPTGAPQFVNASATGPTTILVRWSPPPCRDQNGNVLDYTIRYHPSTGSSSEIQEIETTAPPYQYPISGLTVFREYSIQVAAKHRTAGTGPFSSPVTAVIIGVPGGVTSLEVIPDIVSVVVTWEPPTDGRGSITQYELGYGLSNSENFIASMRLNGNTTSYRVTRLAPETAYMFVVTPSTSVGVGPRQRVVRTTRRIGEVRGVVVEVLNSTAVNVSWQRLPSQDIAYYKVYYSGRSVLFPGGSSWGVVGGGEQFEVAAVVIVNGQQVEGERPTLPGEGGGGGGGEEGGDGLAGTIAGGLIGALIVVLLVAMTVLFVYIVWKRSRTGKFNVAKSNLELKHRSTTLPLPDFDRPGGTISTAKPIIHEYPKDTIAIEGEKVMFDPKFSGTPSPSIAWYHDGCMVMSDYSIDISESGKLTFVCVELRHAGNYRFTVSNNAGSVQGQVDLAVCSEGDENALDLKGMARVKSNPVEISNFGVYVAEQHGSSSKGFRDQYFSLESGEKGKSTTVSSLPENKPCNRFLNIVPYDDNRIRIKPFPRRPDCSHDYINASYISGYYIPNKFVTTQGPIGKTMVDFWRLVWQLRPPTIVMVTNLKEGSKVKCEQYWPDQGTQEYGPFKVTLTDQQVFADYTIRQLLVSVILEGTGSKTAGHTPLKVGQYQFTAWPDHGVPDYVTPMLSFHRRISAEHKCVKGPMLVHCSAGVGRTGTFITIDIALQQAENEGKVDIPAIITKIRTQRMKMVQTVDQYIFIHDAVLEALVCGNTQVPAPELHSTIERLSEWDPRSGKTGFETQFHVLNQLTPKPEEASCPTALQYMDRNRSTSYLPTDRWRVVLKAEHPDYINASFANGYKQKKAFIIAQGPLDTTCRDFWKMVYERNCGAIVMLSAIVENGEDVCFRYWPMNGVEQYGEFRVSNLELTRHDEFLERTFSVTDSKSGQAHRVSHFHLLDWGPDCKTSSPSGIVSVINCVMNVQRRSGNSPVVVHCSDTVTRSGIFCATMTTIEGCKAESVVDVFQVVKALRIQKPGAVMTVEHYRFIYDLVLLFLNNYSNYSNFK